MSVLGSLRPLAWLTVSRPSAVGFAWPSPGRKNQSNPKADKALGFFHGAHTPVEVDYLAEWRNR